MTRFSLRGVATVAAVLAAMCSVAQAVVARDSRPNRYPYLAWSATDAVVVSTVLVSGLALAAAAIWLTWTLPHTPTGRWLAAAAVSYSVWALGVHWQAGASPWAEHLAPVLLRGCVVMALLPWPTGRLETAWRRPVELAVALYVVIGVVTEFVGFRYSSWNDPTLVLPSIGNLVVGEFVSSLTMLLLRGLAPALLLAAVLRRHRAMAPAMRRSCVPMLVSVVVLIAGEWWVTTTDLVLRPVTGMGSWAPHLLGWRVGVDLGRFGVIAALLVVADLFRRRWSGPPKVGVIDLAAVDSPDTETEIRRLLGDPSVKVCPPGAEGAEAPGTVRVGLVDQRGRDLGTVVYSDSLTVTAAHLDAVVGAVALALIRDRRRRVAQERLAEVRQVQQQVVEAHDRARRRLERDLHDGVQQRLVALTLQASMVARRHGAGRGLDGDRDDLRRELMSTIEFIDELLHSECPAVIDPGLAAGLTALDATVPLATRLEIFGDVPRQHPAAPVLYFVASEAVTNSLKHACASEIVLRLRVEGGAAELMVGDDGVGSVSRPSPAIARRLEVLPSTLALSSPPGQGTTIQVRVDLELTAGAEP